MSALRIYGGIVMATLGLILRAGAVDDLWITEFMAANSGPVVDEDGDTSDWIEIHNAGTNVVNLEGWFLTDKASNLANWRFPATNLVANAYLIVFASGKDHRVPGAPLHTSFQLKASGDYLALVRPDGTNIASAYSPAYPPQVPGISYGIPVQPFVTTLIASGATARVRVPLDGSLGSSWTTTTFDDAAWSSLRTGVGFEAGGQGPLTIVADSVADFSGTSAKRRGLEADAKISRRILKPCCERFRMPRSKASRRMTKKPLIGSVSSAWRTRRDTRPPALLIHFLAGRASPVVRSPST